MSGKRILLVDDEGLTRKLIRSVLVTRGFDVELAWNGKQALERLSEWRPDLVITDVMMPEMDGFTLVRQMRADKDLALVPVIFLSARNDAEDRVRGFRLGADDYLPKPFFPEELVTRVERVVERGAAMQERVEQRWAPQAPAATPPPDLTGDLGTLGVSGLLMVVEQKQRSGVLSITAAGHNALLEFRDGRPVTAQLDFAGGESLDGAEAVYKLLGWEAGTFVFKSCEVTAADTIQRSTTSLLLEGARRIDEGHRTSAES